MFLVLCGYSLPKARAANSLSDNGPSSPMLCLWEEQQHIVFRDSLDTWPLSTLLTLVQLPQSLD